MSNIVTWFKPATLQHATYLTHKIGAFNKLCQNAYNFSWTPVYQNTEVDPTDFAIEHAEDFMDAVHPYISKKWTVAATAQNNPHGVIASIGDDLFTQEEIACITVFDVEGWYENYV
jgi:hypothetical protein